MGVDDTMSNGDDSWRQGLEQVLLDEALTLAVSVAFARVVLRDGQREPLGSWWTWVHALGLGLVTFATCDKGLNNQQLALLAAAEVTSFLMGRGYTLARGLACGVLVAASLLTGLFLQMARVGVSIVAYWAASKATMDLKMASATGVAIFACLPAAVAWLLPVSEFADAFSALEGVHASALSRSTFRRATLVVTLIAIHVQVAVGWAGVEYLRAAQRRKNALIDGVANKKLSARDFARSRTALFVWRFAVPYLMQRVALEAVYELSFRKLSFGVARALRVEAVLGTSLSHQHSALGALSGCELTLEAYGEAAEASARRMYELVSRKVFSLPKLSLLPSLVASHPFAFTLALPVLVAIDGIKARLVSSLTTAVERAKAAARTATSKRSRVEAHDVSRAGAAELVFAASWTERQWHDLSRSIESHLYAQTSLETARRYVRWLYWSDFLTPAIEVALAGMLERSIIDAADLWVVSRALEDSLDLLLTRSRAEADLAALATDVSRLKDLVKNLDTFRAHRLANVTCGTAVGGTLELDNLIYERGAASARVTTFRASSGEVIAITGPNSGGKSTLLALMRVCDGVSPPPAAAVLAPARVALPAGRIAHVPQRPFCPLHVRPIDWFFFTPDTNAHTTHASRNSSLAVAATILDSLDFFAATERRHLHETLHAANDAYRILLEEHDDYCGSLSGGQLIKFELARQIFAPVQTGGGCPALILLDESLAPLDPQSKRKVQQLLRATCSQAIILVVYHADAQSTEDSFGEATTTCVESAGFFTDVAHFVWRQSSVSTVSPLSSLQSRLYNENKYLELTRVGTCERQRSLA